MHDDEFNYLSSSIPPISTYVAPPPFPLFLTLNLDASSEKKGGLSERNEIGIETDPP
jgi:hypothetical protein